MKISKFELNDERNGYNDGEDCGVGHITSNAESNAINVYWQVYDNSAYVYNNDCFNTGYFNAIN